MKVTHTFNLHFEIEGNKYDFKIDADSLDDSFRILQEHLQKIIAELTK